MGLYNDYRSVPPKEITLTELINHNVPFDSEYLEFLSSANVSVTGLQRPGPLNEKGAVTIENHSEYEITLVAKSLDSDEDNRFQMETDVILGPGEMADFRVIEHGFYLMNIYPDIKKFYYSVRDADAVDVAAAEKTIYDSDPIVGGFGLHYKVLQFTEPHTFAGTETWVQQITSRDVILNKYNPVFFDLSALDPYFIGRNITEGARNNRKIINDILIETAAGHLFKNGLTWSSLDKFTFNLYWLKLSHYGQLGNMGLVLKVLQDDLTIITTPATVSVTDLYTGTSYPVAQLTAAMLSHAIAICIEYKKKYPDGTV